MDNIVNFVDEQVQELFPTQTMVLEEGNDPLKEFNEFKAKIRKDSTLTQFEKCALINKKREKMEENIRRQEDGRIRVQSIVDLKIRLSNPKIEKIKPSWANDILEKINIWERNPLGSITLDSESLYDILKMIDESNTCSAETKLIVSCIFRALDWKHYREYSTMMDDVMKQSVEDEKRLAEQKLFEEKRESEIQNMMIERHNLLESLIYQMDRISAYDPNVFTLGNAVADSLNYYLNLRTEKLEINTEFYDQFILFVKSISLANKLQNRILEICVREEK